MSKKEIKFTIKLNVDRKEQLSIITASAKDVKKAFDGASSSIEGLGKTLTNINQAFGALLWSTFATLTGISGNTAEVSTQLAAIFTALIKPPPTPPHSPSKSPPSTQAPTKFSKPPC